MILISPLGGKSSKDYERECHMTESFRKPGARWSGGRGSEKLKPMDMMGFADGKSKRMYIFQIQRIETDDLKDHVRPWWELNKYEIRSVLYLSQMYYSISLVDYAIAHGMSPKIPIVGRAVHEWDEKKMELVQKIPYAMHVSLPPEEVKEPPKEVGYVYFITEEPFAGFVKIGHSKNDPGDRCAQLQTGNPRELRVLHCVTCLDYPKFERYLHQCFLAKKHKNEWFQLQIEEVQELVKFLEN